MSRWGRSFFGLPGPEDDGFLDGVRAFKLAQLSELRLVCQEVGTLTDARAMPLEVRKWWIQQMLKKTDGGGQQVQTDPRTGNRLVTKDVR